MKSWLSDYRFIIRHFSDNHGDIFKPELAAGFQAAVSRNQFITAVWQRSGEQRRDRSDLADAFDNLRHILIVRHGERMITERLYFFDGNALNILCCLIFQ